MRTHKHCRECHVSLPRVHHLLGGETLQVNKPNINPSLDKGEVPPIATTTKTSTQSCKWNFKQQNKSQKLTWIGAYCKHIPATKKRLGQTAA